MANTVQGTLNINKAAYVKRAYYALRPEQYYDAFCDVEPSDTTHRGSSYTWNITADLAEVTTPIGEEADVTPVTPTDSPVTLTPQEYVNAVKTTALARSSAFMSYNPIIANLIGFNAGISTDAIARNAFKLGANTLFAKGSGSTQTHRSAITTTNTLDGNIVRQAVAVLRNANVQTFNGKYIAFINPDVAYDFKGATGGTNWSDPQVYGQSQEPIFNGYIGAFQGAMFIESPRAPIFTDGSAAGTAVTKTTTTSTASATVAGVANQVTVTTSASHGYVVGQGITFSGNGSVGLPAACVITSVPTATTFTFVQSGVSAGSPSVTTTGGSVDVYRTLVFGKEAFAKCYNPGEDYSTQPVLGDTPVTDVAERFTGVYWKHLVSYGIFRESCLRSIESASSIGAN